MQNKIFRKSLVIGIIILFFGASIVPCISSVSNQLKLKNTPVEPSSFNPFKQGWEYRTRITINHDKVAGDLINFPVLISFVYADLGDKAQIDGDDILFMDNKGEANQLYHEIEYYDESSGKLIAWVNIPSLSSTKDTIFYMYYGNYQCASQQYPEKVWDNDYCSVWHMSDIKDSTGNENDGTNHGASIVPGKICNAIDLEKYESDYIDFGDMTQPADGTLATMTFEAWINPESFPCDLMDKYDASQDKCSYEIVIHVNGKLVMYAYPWYGRYTGNYSADNTIVPGNWYYIAGVYNLAGTNNNVDLFVNGYEIPSTLDSNGQVDYMYDGDVADEVGRRKSEPRYGDGIFDEIRWSKVMRSDEWIKTSYNTMNDPSGFFKLGLAKSKQKENINKLLLNYIKNYSNLFPILQKIIQRLELL